MLRLINKIEAWLFPCTAQVSQLVERNKAEVKELICAIHNLHTPSKPAAANVVSLRKPSDKR